MIFSGAQWNANRERLYRWVLGLLLAGYGIFIGVNFAPVAAGADSGGYMLSARLITQGRISDDMRRLPEYKPNSSWVHTPLGYLDTKGDGALRPTYPVGLPLHYAFGAMIAGWHWGVLAVGVVVACAAVAATYLIARELGLARPLALGGTMALGISTVFLFPSFIPMSDTPATAWCAFAFLFSLWARRGSAWWAVASGAAFAVAVLVRPSNAVFFPALLLAVGSWRNLFALGAGGLPGAIFNAIYNHVLYGKVTESGYGPIFDIFRSEYVQSSLLNYWHVLPFALPLVFVAILGLPWLPWKTRPWELLALGFWAVVFFAFYAFYEFTHLTWWYLRFVIPSFPAVVLLAMWVLDGGLGRVTERWRFRAQCGVAAVVVLVSLWGSVRLGKEHHLMLLKAYQKPYTDVSDWTRAHLPPNAVILCLQTSSALHFYTDFAILRWDALDPEPVKDLKAALEKSGRPLYAALFPHEEEDALQKRFPGNWEKVADLKDVMVWRYRGPR